MAGGVDEGFDIDAFAEGADERVKLVWSNLASNELRALRRYSVEHRGREVALRYLIDVRNACEAGRRTPAS